MKITLFLNDYFVNYNKPPLKSKQELDRNIIQQLYNEDDTFILRGEPTLRHDFNQVLDIFNKKNYILTTHLYDIDKILQYKKNIPYISMNWDGIINDSIREKKPYTADLIKLLHFFKSKKTIQRINYTISNHNLAFFDIDVKEKSLQQILKDNEQELNELKNCPLSEQCWFSHHRKEI
jgi:MoaA/NifB/PqqE/SkfB family radical SAM enzyme